MKRLTIIAGVFVVVALVAGAALLGPVRACSAALSLFGAANVCIPTFPVQTEAAAIRIGRDFCLSHPPLLVTQNKDVRPEQIFASLEWSAERKGGVWNVSTMPSVMACANPHLLQVDVPVNGPMPKECWDNLAAAFAFMEDRSCWEKE